MNLRQHDTLLLMLAAILMVCGISGFVVILANSAGKKLALENKPPEPTILFSCYKQEGTKCSVTSNKENPCSYAFLVCKTPEGKTIYRSENIK